MGGGAQVEKQSLMSSHCEQVHGDFMGLGCNPTIDVCHARVILAPLDES